MSPSPNRAIEPEHRGEWETFGFFDTLATTDSTRIPNAHLLTP